MKKVLCFAFLLLFGFSTQAMAVTLVPGPDGFLIPDYFGNVPNYANSPLPRLDGSGNPIPGTGMRKFVDGLPGLGPSGANNLKQYLPVAVADTTTYTGSDYYEIAAVEWSEQMHSDLPPTKVRGYVQLETPVNAATSKHIPLGGGHFGYDNPHYLGPVILAQREKPVRVKFTNLLPTGAGGNLFIPVDTSYMGAGFVPSGNSYSTTEKYTQNRTAVHLHGATTPWISDGTVFQWFTPAGETTSYPKGVSVANVPDMPDPGPGSMTFFYTNQQSARLMFYHDHAAGITRLNVYAGMAAGYLVSDSNTTRDPITPIYGEGIPLVIQDKSFVPDNTVSFTNLMGTFPSQLAAQDPTWDSTRWGGFGQLWFPHVYMPNQNPGDVSGANAMGRWDYGAWFWPPFTGLIYGPIANPYYDPVNAPWEPPQIPGVPSVSGVPESFMDTPVVNGTAYPTLTVDPKPYRFRILSVGNDRFFNLSLWVAADKTTPTTAGSTGTVLCTNNATVLPANCTEVKMVPFDDSQNAISPFPSWWYTLITNGFTFDDRAGGVPDPTTRGPAMIQIATEGGFLPAPVVIKNQPINYVYNRRDITVGNVLEKALFLGPAERADIIVDFTNFAGKTLIFYNDAPAPVPAADPRLDYYTGDPDQTDTGGAPSTLPGYGPNTRTIMQIVVNGSGGTAPVDDVNQTILTQLQTVLPAAFAASQESVIVPQAAYNGVYGTSVVNQTGVNLSTIQGTSLSFPPLGQTTPVLFDFYPKSIIEDFQMDYGRMNAILGVEIPHSNSTTQTSILQNLTDPPTEIIKITDPSLTPIGTMADGTQIWKITHNGVDTHAVHVHMFTVQVVNRVGWDGAIRQPDPNELGFKDTVRMNPLEDIIVALRPIKLDLPFKVPNSTRPLAPESPLGATLGPTGMPLFQNVDPNGNPVTITNQLVNFGWEYVWHCHLLGHEENDMMRPMALASAPDAPSNLVATPNGSSLDLTWTDNSVNETSWTVQTTSNGVLWTNVTSPFASTTTPSVGDLVTYTVLSAPANAGYRVIASNTVGSIVSGYPQVTADSVPSNVVVVGVVHRRPPLVDFNMDFRTDVAVYRSSNGGWYIIPSSGAAPYGVGWGGNATDKPVPGDYDGDGKTDIAVYRASNGGWYIIPSSGAAPYGVGWGGDATDIPAPGDYDGDFKTDVAVYRASNGGWYVMPSSGAAPYGVGWGGDATDIPAPGDYDGDGKTDMAVYRVSTGAWYINPSSGAAPYGVGWGGDPNDKPVPGDYDGDGKDDIAIYRSNTGAWYIKPSSGAAPYGVGWGGTATDKPVPGDYDGDGKTDIAIYRTSSGGWYIVPSSGAARYGVGWGGDPSDVPITKANF